MSQVWRWIMPMKLAADSHHWHPTGLTCVRRGTTQ